MTVIAIKYADDAKPGKKYGSIKTADGTKYLVPAGLNGVFKAGTTVDVPTKGEAWTEIPIVAGRPGAAGSTGPATPPPIPGDGLNMPPPLDAPAAPHANGGNDTGAQIFVTGVMQRMMGSGKYETQDIPLIAQALVSAWNMHIKDKL